MAMGRVASTMLIGALIRLVEGIFLLGIIGSAVVVLLTTVEDIRELLLPEHAGSKEVTTSDHKNRSVAVPQANYSNL